MLQLDVNAILGIVAPLCVQTKLVFAPFPLGRLILRSNKLADSACMFLWFALSLLPKGGVCAFIIFARFNNHGLNTTLVVATELSKGALEMPSITL